MLRLMRHSRLSRRILGPPKEEEQPLLSAETSGLSSRTPLPFKQVLVLCLCRFGEPIALLLPFPFINDQLWSIGVTDNPAKLGFYAGTIESLFAFCTFATILSWGRLSDRIGRLPVLIIGLTGVAISTTAFGFAQSFTALVIARCMAGSLNGNVVVIKSMLGELTDDTNQGQAFAYLPMAWSSGSVLGPMIGGYLANPAKHYPNIFGGIEFFEAFPYALPCIVGALFPAAGALIAFFFLDETLSPAQRLQPEPKAIEVVRGRSHYGAHTSSTVPVPVDSDAEDACSIAVRDENELASEHWLKTLFTSRRVQSALLVYALLALQTVALDACFVLFCYTSTTLGGLSFNEQSIGIALSLGGVFTVSFQLALFPPLQRRIGTTRLYRTLMCLYPIVFALFPVMSVAAKRDEAEGDGKARRTWTLMVVYLLVKSLANISYACNMLTITDAAPSRLLLGSLNGVAQMLASLCRAVGPLAASSLFAISKEHQWLRGEAVWVVLVAVAVLSALSTGLLVDEPSAWREQGSVAGSGMATPARRLDEEGDDLDAPRIA